MYKIDGRDSRSIQLSVLGLSYFKFNIYINDIFFALKGVGISNFADDTTPCVSDTNLKSLLEHGYANRSNL